MEKCYRNERIVFLADYETKEGIMLANSFRASEIPIDVVSLQDNISVCKFSLSVQEFVAGENCQGRPLYYNEIPIPQEWTVNYGENGLGQITYLGQVRGSIHFLDCEKKYQVESVDWYDLSGKLFATDFYNYYGHRYARTVYDETEKPIIKTWYTLEQKEAIVETLELGVFNYLLDGDNKTFTSSLDMLAYHMKQQRRHIQSVVINSLSTPFFFVNRIQEYIDSCYLFWQEPTRDDIPGNMTSIFSNPMSKIKVIYVQDHEAYSKLIDLGADRNIVKELGYVFHFKKENKGVAKSLICTNSDNIAHIESIIQTLPEMEFHITAITSMSDKLLNLSKYENVKLYPGVKKQQLKQLFIECDYYLDINYGSEICNAVEEAFLHNHILLAFSETIHNRRFVPDDSVFRFDDKDKLIETIKQCMADTLVRDDKILLQKQKGGAECAGKFRTLFLE